MRNEGEIRHRSSFREQDGQLGMSVIFMQEMRAIVSV
jgi:hypothetical protein